MSKCQIEAIQKRIQNGYSCCRERNVLLLSDVVDTRQRERLHRTTTLLHRQREAYFGRRDNDNDSICRMLSDQSVSVSSTCSLRLREPFNYLYGFATYVKDSTVDLT